MEKKQGRKRLRPWLELHLDNKTYKGLKWMNKDKKIFRISWKHQNKSCWDPSSDAEIFKGWAIHSGKFKEGETENPPEWKTRLRTALTKLSDVEEMKDLHKTANDQEDPYRAYRFLDDEEVLNNKFQQQGASGIVPSPSSSFQTSPASLVDFLEPEFEDIVKMETECGNSSNIPTVVLECDLRGNHQMNDFDSTETEKIFPSNTNGACQAGSHDSSDLPFNIPRGFMEPNIMPHQDSRCPSDLANLDMNSLEQCVGMSGDCAMSFGSMPSKDSITLNIFKVKVFFVGDCVTETAFDTKGARLYSGNLPKKFYDAKEHSNVFGPNTLFQICIPSIDTKHELCISRNHKNLIREIQKNMERGLVLEYRDDKLYVKRLCKARVFAWTSDGKSTRLNRESNSEVCVFDYIWFKQQLSQCCSDRNVQGLPSSSVFFSFGQEYKMDPSEKNILLHVEITHIEAEDLLTQVLNSDAEQNESELLISNPNSEDALASLLKDKLSLEENSNYHSECIFQNMG